MKRTVGPGEPYGSSELGWPMQPRTRELYAPTKRIVRFRNRSLSCGTSKAVTERPDSPANGLIQSREMDAVATVIYALVVAAVGFVLAWISKDRFKALERRIDRLEDGMERFQGSLDGMRSDLTQVTLAVGARPRASGSSS
jgi:hypothetical protein